MKIISGQIVKPGIQDNFTRVDNAILHCWSSDLWKDGKDVSHYTSLNEVAPADDMYDALKYLASEYLNLLHAHKKPLNTFVMPGWEVLDNGDIFYSIRSELKEE